jgi:hypothetical protein
LLEKPFLLLQIGVDARSDRSDAALELSGSVLIHYLRAETHLLAAIALNSFAGILCGSIRTSGATIFKGWPTQDAAGGRIRTNAKHPHSGEHPPKSERIPSPST